jgi:hypothetical protein
MNAMTEMSNYRHEKVLFVNNEKAGLKAIIAIHNTNLGPETTPETVTGAKSKLDSLCSLSGLPLWMHAATKEVAQKLDGPVLAMELQEKYFDLPSQSV